MIYGYARVSTKGQARDGNGLEAQIEQLKKEGAETIFADTFTGTTTTRPEFDKLIATIKPGDTLIVTKLDRIARTALQGSKIVQDLLNKNISVNVLNMGKMDNTPTGKLICQIMFAFAEFERNMIVERTQEGKAIAKCDPNFREGRPKKYGKERIEYALNLLNQGNSYKKVERITSISVSTLQRARKKQRQKYYDTDLKENNDSIPIEQKTQI